MEKKIILRVILTLLTICLLGGCSQKAVVLPEGAAENEILTFTPNTENKPIIHVGLQFSLMDKGMFEALAQKFPDYQFITDFGISAGSDSEFRLPDYLQNDNQLDMLITMGFDQLPGTYNEILYDLSAEPFLERYLLSSLQSVSDNGHIYFLPAPSSISGIAYNKDMFTEYGWELPSSVDEFFSLCKQIQSEAGIRPFSTNFKYSSQALRLLGSMLYTELFQTPEDALWLMNILAGKGTFSGHMEPLYALAQRFFDEGVIIQDDFTASLTKQRQAFWAGEYAMIDYDSAIFSYAADENAPFELGFIPFPAKKPENSGFFTISSSFLAIPKHVENDPEKLELMKEIFAYLSSVDGQRSMAEGNIRISNLQDISIMNSEFEELGQQAYDRGNLFPTFNLDNNGATVRDLLRESLLILCQGSSQAEALGWMDEKLAQSFAEGGYQAPVYEKIAIAEENFSTLETSYYIADKMKEAASTQIAFMPDKNSFFRSNLTKFNKGDITSDINPFIMKGMGNEDYLTVYKMSGAQIRQQMEHPTMNGQEIDNLTAASGMKIEYAPWNKRGSRVLSLTLADGTALKDDQLYSVAAFPGIIADEYISEVGEPLAEIGRLQDLMPIALAKDGTIKPDIKDRVKLVWPEISEK